ncbi:hypothetical protein SAMN06296241_2532 [Salinimicrobium sediminis]|uniref:VanZ like family protein n=1 Tax=Salinimicrobium sediminis TaxID=1343891 RepID=A0A285X6J3_9FLAO|nr:hypothetical protein SAMN06296241_2532 [Salinimicrobium sediminis]
MKKSYLFSILCCSLFLVNLFLLKFFFLPEFFSSYLNDLLCMPVVLGICLFLIRKFSRKEQLKISLFSAFSLAAFYSLYFELYLPEVTQRYTADVVDVLLYFTGAFAFWLVQRKDDPPIISEKKKAA